MPRLPVPKGCLRWVADGGTFYNDPAHGTVYTLVGPSVFFTPVNPAGNFDTEGFSHAYHDAEGGPWDRAAYDRVRDIVLGRIPPPDPKPLKASGDHACPECDTSDQDDLIWDDNGEILRCDKCGTVFCPGTVCSGKPLRVRDAVVTACAMAVHDAAHGHWKSLKRSVELSTTQDERMALVRLLLPRGGD
jgi:hypothetical protein